MELSQKCLGALFQFKQMVLLDATCMEPIVQEVVEMVKPAGKQDCSIVANLEKREIVRGIATLLLQAAKHALSREQLEEYTFQIGWTTELITYLGSVYANNYQLFRAYLGPSNRTVPTLKSVQCSLADPTLLSSKNGNGFGYANTIATYNVVFHYNTQDGTEVTSEKVLNSLQLQNVIQNLKSALDQCDLIIGKHGVEGGTELM